MIEKISMYDPLKGLDIEAFTDGYAFDEYGYLYLMSILGHDSAVKAISAGIVTLKDITILQEGTWKSYTAMHGEKYRIMSARLDSGLLHQIVTMDALFNQGDSKRDLVYIGNNRDINQTIFHTIKKNLGTPLLTEWEDWLIREIQKEGLIEVMQGNVPIAKLSLTEKQLDLFISEGIKQRRIRF